MEVAQLLKMLRNPDCQDRAVIRLELANQRGTGIRLTADEVYSIVGHDQALQQRVINEMDRQNGVPASEIGA